ncbi:purine-nucleoside phosphorylase [Vibrio owensii]|uniref:purine-nucleoside phosphorylase n=1 Tax=Vibrio owensii TaxID=696485 RepID=UPI00339B1D91
MTPYINANHGDFAETVLMPGDPQRAEWIAKNLLDKAEQVCNLRHMTGYTGYYKGKRISVMPHGIGIPCALLYCNELVEHFGVKKIIRVGTCGSVHPLIKMRDIIIGMSASTDSQVNRRSFEGFDLAATASYPLVRNLELAAQSLEIPVKIGSLFTTDTFFNPDPSIFCTLGRFGIVGIEMEAAGIYAMAMERGIEAVSICTVSDTIFASEDVPHEERAQFEDMAKIALESALL